MNSYTFRKNAKRISSLAALAALVILCVLSLSACGLMNLSKVGVITLEVQAGDNLDKIGEDYRAQIGTEFEIEAVWNKTATVSPSVKWYVSENGGAAVEIEGNNKKILSYSFDELSTSYFEFYATADNVTSSNKIKVRTAYADVQNLTISAVGGEIVQGVLQQRRGEYAQIELVLNWNKDFVDPSDTYTVKWSVKPENGIETDEGNDNPYVFTPDEDWADNTTIKAQLLYQNGTQSKSAQIVVNLYEKFDYVEKVNVGVKDGYNEEIGNGDNQYVQLLASATATPQSVKLSVDVEPKVGTNLSAAVKWTVRDKDGTRTLPSTEREIDFVPVYGENIVTATIENVESAHANVAVIASSYYDKKNVSTNNCYFALADTFVWNGSVENCYITDSYDLGALLNYLVANRMTADSVNSADGDVMSIKLAQSSWKNGSSVSETFENAVKDILQSVDQAGSFAVSYSIEKICLTSSSQFGNPEIACPSSLNVTQIATINHYSTSTAVRGKLACDDYPTSAKVSPVANSDMLYRVLSWGYKPEFETLDDGVTLSAAGAKAKAIYDEARGVLGDICDDNMTDYEKVRAVFEWVVNEIDYDYELADGNADVVVGGASYPRRNCNGFYLEGVFDDNRAVCDGKSKAVALLCAMEGIKCLRVGGYVNGNESNAHAWNKVLVDAPKADGTYDGVKEWYLLDSTWGDPNTGKSGSNYEESEAKKYFLTSDSAASTHTATSVLNPAAVTAFDYFAVTSVTYGSKNLSLTVTSNAQMNEMLAFCETKASGFCIEIKSSITMYSTLTCTVTSSDKTNNIYRIEKK